MKCERLDGALVKSKRGLHLKSHQFQKGNTAAKGFGRPRKDPGLQELCRLRTKECVDRLVDFMRSDEERTRDRIVALKTLLSYGHGEPRAAVDINSTIDIRTDFLEALKLCNAKGREQRERDAKMIEATVEDAEIVSVKSKPKRRVCVKTK